MVAAVWGAWAPDWLLYDKVSFDGINKIIYVHPEVISLDIRADLYTSWVDWSSLHDNSKYLPAIRYAGLDPIGVGVFTGDVYFLINGWKLSINLQAVRVAGALYSDDYDTAYYTPTMVAQYAATVSALVNTVATGGGSGGSGPTVAQIRQELDTNSTKLSQIQNTVTALPTAVQTRQELDTNSVKLAQIKAILDSMIVPTASQNADAVWAKPVSAMTDKTTIGGYISKVLLSVPKFLGLK